MSKRYSADIFSGIAVAAVLSQVLFLFCRFFQTVCAAVAACILFQAHLSMGYQPHGWRTIHRFDSANSVFGCSVFFFSPR